MAAYYLNTEANHLAQSPHDIWIAKQRAYVSTEPYGRKLAKLQPDDVCFMYVNTVGVIAVGTVHDEWDGQPSSTPQVYIDRPDLQPEYSRPVTWDLVLRDRPIPAPVLRAITRCTPRQAVQRIRHDDADRLLAFAKQQLTVRSNFEGFPKL
jgi:hypothetical protein